MIGGAKVRGSLSLEFQKHVHMTRRQHCLRILSTVANSRLLRLTIYMQDLRLQPLPLCGSGSKVIEVISIPGHR